MEIYRRTELALKIGLNKQLSGWQRSRINWSPFKQTSQKKRGGEDEGNMNRSSIDNVVCKPTDLTGLMTPGLSPMGGHWSWLGHRAG